MEKACKVAGGSGGRREGKGRSEDKWYFEILQANDEADAATPAVRHGNAHKKNEKKKKTPS